MLLACTLASSRISSRSSRHLFPVHRLGVGRERVVEFGQAHNMQRLAGGCLSRCWHELFVNELLGFIERAARSAVFAAPDVGHARRIVENHDVRCGSRLVPLPVAAPADVAGEEHPDEEHEQAPQEEEQQLLQNLAAAHPLLGFEQELHRRPLHPPEPYPVNQVDDDGGEHQRRPGDDGERVQERGKHRCESRRRVGVGPPGLPAQSARLRGPAFAEDARHGGHPLPARGKLGVSGGPGWPACSSAGRGTSTTPRPCNRLCGVGCSRCQSECTRGAPR